MHFKLNIKQEEIEEKLSEFNFEGDLELVKNEELVHQMCTHELNLKDELQENKDGMIEETFNCSDDEVDNCDHHLAYNCINSNAGTSETDITILEEKKTSNQMTSNSSDDGYIKYSSRRQWSTHKRPFKCTVCDNKFTEKDNLLRHHSLEKLFQCLDCEYKCVHKSNLVSHMKSHTNDKTFKSTVCDTKFKQKCSLARHMKTHTHEKLFQCFDCEYKCADKSNLVSHMRIHTHGKPFKCFVCEYKCARKADLVRHMKTHTHEKPFQCFDCEYKCAHKNSLVRHMKIHTHDNKSHFNV